MAWMAWVYLVVAADLNTNQGVFDEIARSLGGAFYQAVRPWGTSGSCELNSFSISKIVSVV
jgi:hypothetical protein